MNKDRMFLEGNIGKTILKMSIPLIISQLINVLYNIVDRIYIGNMEGIGEQALAGVGVTFPIIMVVAAFSSLFGYGGAPIASIKLGEGKKDEAKKIMSYSFLMLFVVGIILTVVLLKYDVSLLYLFGAKEEVLKYSLEYLDIYALGTVSVMLTLGLTAYITGQGYSMISMISVIIGSVMNIILDPILMFVFDLGVAGAAWATVISQTSSAIFILVFLTSSKPIIRLSIKGLFRSVLKFDLKTVLAITALGISPFIMNSTESLVQITFNLKIKEYSTTSEDYVTYLNLMTIMLSIMSVILLPLSGFTQGSTPLISYNYGAGQIERVKKAFKIILTVAITYTFSFYLVILAFPNIFVRIFNNDPTLLKISPKLIRMFFFGIGIMGIQNACQSTFMALRQSVISLLLALLRKIILLIPITIILPRFLGIKGVFYAEPIADFLAVSSTLTVFLLTFNRILNNKVEELSMRIGK